MSNQSFKDLIVWQREIELAVEIYRATDNLPREEQYGLTSQMRRSAVSVSSNIAEGRKRGTRKDYTQFPRIADGSCAELETQIIIAEQLYPKISFNVSKKLLEEIQKMLSALIRRLLTPNT